MPWAILFLYIEYLVNLVEVKSNVHMPDRKSEKNHQ